MSTATSVDLLAFGVEVVVLALCALALAYSLVAYRQQVLYGGGVLWLATSLGLVALGAIIELWGLIVHSDVLAVASFVIYTGASAAIAVSMWSFARGFIHIDQQDADIDAESGQNDETFDISPGSGDDPRGFDDAGD